MALLPLAWLGGLTWRGKKRELQWWLLALAFAISWLADTVAHVLPPLLVSVVYPVSQATLVIAVFDAKVASKWLAAFTVLGIVAVALQGIEKPDAVVHLVTWLVVVSVVWLEAKLPRLRGALLVYFGLGLVCWIVYVARPGVPTWSVYQSVRLIGLCLFCWAAMQALPPLRLSRRRV